MSLTIELENPIMEDYNELELFLGKPFKNPKNTPDNSIKDFINEKPNVFKL